MNLICWLFGHNYQVPNQIHAGGMVVYEANTGLDPMELQLLPTEIVVINSGTRPPQVINARPLNWVWCKRCARQSDLKLNDKTLSKVERQMRLQGRALSNLTAHGVQQ